MLILIFVWLISAIRLPLRSTSRSRAVVARRAHNPKVGSSNLPFATRTASQEAYFFETWGLIYRQSRDGSRDAANAGRDADLKRLHSNLPFATRTSQGAFIFAQRSG